MNAVQLAYSALRLRLFLAERLDKSERATPDRVDFSAAYDLSDRVYKTLRNGLSKEDDELLRTMIKEDDNG